MSSSYYLISPPSRRTDYLEKLYSSIIEEYKKYNYIQNGWLKPIGDVRMFYIDHAGLPDWREWKILTYNQLRLSQLMPGGNHRNSVSMYEGRSLLTYEDPEESFELEDKEAGAEKRYSLLGGIDQSAGLLLGSRRVDFLAQQFYSITEEYKKYNYVENGWLKPLRDVRMFYIDHDGLPGWHEWKILTYNQLRLAQIALGYTYMRQPHMYGGPPFSPYGNPMVNMWDYPLIIGRPDHTATLMQGYPYLRQPHMYGGPPFSPYANPMENMWDYPSIIERPDQPGNLMQGSQLDYWGQQFYSIIEEYKKFDYVTNGWLKPMGDVNMFYIDHDGLPGWREWKILTYNQLRIAQMLLGYKRPHPVPMSAGPQFSPYGNPFENLSLEDNSIFEGPYQSINLLHGSRLDYLEQQYYNIFEEYKKYNYVQTGWLKGVRYNRMFYIDNAGLPGWREWKILTYNQLRLVQQIFGYNYF